MVPISHLRILAGAVGYVEALLECVYRSQDAIRLADPFSDANYAPIGKTTGVDRRFLAIQFVNVVPYLFGSEFTRNPPIELV